jgi:hypothetical protein
MRNPYTDNSSFVRNIYKKQYLNKIEEPIIDKYYTDVRNNQKAIPEILIDRMEKQLSTNEMRNIIFSELKSVLSNPSQFIEELFNNNEIEIFYKFANLFLNQIKGVRNIDSNYLSQLWNVFKENLLSGTFSTKIKTIKQSPRSTSEPSKEESDISLESEEPLLLTPFGSTLTGEVKTSKRGRPRGSTNKPKTETNVSKKEAKGSGFLVYHRR